MANAMTLTERENITGQTFHKGPGMDNINAYLSLTIFKLEKRAKIGAGRDKCCDNDFAANLLSLEYPRRG